MGNEKGEPSTADSEVDQVSSQPISGLLNRRTRLLSSFYRLDDFAEGRVAADTFDVRTSSTPDWLIVPA